MKSPTKAALSFETILPLFGLLVQIPTFVGIFSSVERKKCGEVGTSPRICSKPYGWYA